MHTLSLLLRITRPHQWIKNLLLFAPLFFSGRISLPLLYQAALGALAFTLAAASAYCLNDVLDAEKDRLHPTKKHRPVASRELPGFMALLLAAVLLLAALLLAHHLSVPFCTFVSSYYALQLLYSLVLKAVPILDILLLSSLYLVRLVAGAVLTTVEPSSWLLITGWLLALMLAIGKRYCEFTQHASAAGSTRPVLRSYSSHYLRHLFTSTGAAALVCYLLWCSEAVAQKRFLPAEAFPTVFFVAFGLFRYQLLVFQRRFDEDPTKGLVTDIPTLLNVILFALYLAWMLYGG